MVINMAGSLNHYIQNIQLETDESLEVHGNHIKN